jgi:hypothetical protein
MSHKLKKINFNIILNRLGRIPGDWWLEKISKITSRCRASVPIVRFSKLYLMGYNYILPFLKRFPTRNV